MLYPKYWCGCVNVVACATVNDQNGWMSVYKVCIGMAWCRCAFENGALVHRTEQNAIGNLSTNKRTVFHLNKYRHQSIFFFFINFKLLSINVRKHSNDYLRTCVRSFMCFEVWALGIHFITTNLITSMNFPIDFFVTQ